MMFLPAIEKPTLFFIPVGPFAPPWMPHSSAGAWLRKTRFRKFWGGDPLSLFYTTRSSWT
jgi:hypothetical protein